jgi:hypothetical protein
LITSVNEFLKSKFNFVHPNEIIQRVVSLFTFYTTHLKQLILGGGAKEFTLSKRIQTSHLLLSSEILHNIIDFSKYIEKFLKNCKNLDEQYLNENFSQLRANCEKHQNKIYKKIVEIMKYHFEVFSKKYIDNDWDSTQPHYLGVSSTLINEMNMNITKLLQGFENIIGNHLDKIRLIFNDVVKLFLEYMKNNMTSIKNRIKTMKGKRRLYDDLLFISNNINNWSSKNYLSDFPNNIGDEIFVQIFGINDKIKLTTKVVKGDEKKN